MLVFISWSEDRSRAVAEALKRWLPVMLQAVKPFLSTNIEKGVPGDDAIHTALESTGFGIICLTRENVENRWIHYEAGALAKSRDRVWTLLLDITPTDVPPPLSRFQHTRTARADFFKLVESINGLLPSPLEPATLSDAFERTWPDLEEAFEAASEMVLPGAAAPVRGERELLEEILELVREIPRLTTPRWMQTRQVGRTAQGLLISESGGIDAFAFRAKPSRVDAAEMVHELLREYPTDHGAFSVVTCRRRLHPQKVMAQLLTTGAFDVITYAGEGESHTIATELAVRAGKEMSAGGSQ